MSPDELQAEIQATAEAIVDGADDSGGLRKQITNLEIFLLQELSISDETDAEIRATFD